MSPNTGNLREFINDLEKVRNFNVYSFLAMKKISLKKFFQEEGLDSIVLGLSGGIDSAVVLNLFACLADDFPDVIKKIVVLIMPIKCNGATGQDASTNDALDICDDAKFNYPQANISIKVADLTQAFVDMTNSAYTYTVDPWAMGQLVSVLRTPALYFNASILQSNGYKSIVVGTTNRDEGSYIGFYGKASDGMVDLQPIADLHKDEVLQLAKVLCVSEKIIKRTPMGDVYDGKCDEDMIGAPYWFLKIYLLSMEYGLVPELLMVIVNEEDALTYITWIRNIDVLHKKNEHKYKVGMPSRFVNILSTKISNGWNV